MGFFSRFLSAITLDNDIDDDDDYLDDEQDDLDDDDDDLYEKPKTGRRFFSRFRSDDPDDDLDDLDDLENVGHNTASKTSKRSTSTASSSRSASSRTAADSKRFDSKSSYESAKKPSFNSGRRDRSIISDDSAAEKKTFRAGKNQKITPIRKKETNNTGMEVSVIRPSSMEDTREIADTLMQNCTVVLNLEGLDVDIAQRVIDFSCGVCYSLNGNLQKVSSYIFILTPENVDISGDFQSILSGAFNLPAMMSRY